MHGAIDYGFLAANIVVPKMLKLNRKARTLFAFFGLTQGILNAFTEQPWAIRPLIPYQVHGQIEKPVHRCMCSHPFCSGSIGNAGPGRSGLPSEQHWSCTSTSPIGR